MQTTDRASSYSETWFRTFLDSIPVEQTLSEVAFLQRQLPIESHPKVLDICCGQGRHAFGLAVCGYQVLGLDLDKTAVERTGKLASGLPNCTFKQSNMLHLPAQAGVFDGVICMWQSFDYFSSADNEAILSNMINSVRPGGKVILDIYNPDYFDQGTSARTFLRENTEVTERRNVQGTRLRVSLTYSHHPDVQDHFD